MVQAETQIQNQYLNIPAGAASVCDLIERDEHNLFELEITEKVRLSPDSFKFKLGFPNQEWIMGLPLCNHMIFRIPSQVEGEKGVGRKYSPVSPIDQKGSIDFVVKCYPVTEEFPNGGVMGRHLEAKEVGDRVLMEGPVGRITYKGNATFVHKEGDRVQRVTKLGLIGGGSGITPLFKLMQGIHLARDPSMLSVKMLYSNKTEADILLREELDAINADTSSPHIQVTHTLTRSTGEASGTNFKSGRVTLEMLQQLGFPEPSDETLIYSCGPKGFNNAIKEFLLGAGYTESMLFK